MSRPPTAARTPTALLIPIPTLTVAHPQRNPGLWGKLEAEGDRAALTARRNASVDRAYAALEEARKARLARKQQEDKWVAAQLLG